MAYYKSIYMFQWLYERFNRCCPTWLLMLTQRRKPKQKKECRKWQCPFGRWKQVFTLSSVLLWYWLNLIHCVGNLMIELFNFWLLSEVCLLRLHASSCIYIYWYANLVFVIYIMVYINYAMTIMRSFNQNND